MYKLEMHLHVEGTSPCAMTDEKTIAELYKSNGYNGVVYTSHYNSFLRKYYNYADFNAYNANFLRHYERLKEECAKVGIDVFFGSEFMPDETSYYEDTPFNAEFLIYGASPNDFMKKAELLLNKNVGYLRDYCKDNGYLLGQAHPFRDMITYRHPELIDCAEVINGNPRQHNHNEEALKFAEDNGLIFTAGSDFHETVDCDAGVYLENPVKTETELVSELKKRRHKVFLV